MSLAEHLNRFGSTMSAKQVTLVSGVAKQVDIDTRTFTLERQGFTPIPVSINAQASEGKEMLLLVPKEGSAVVVGLVDEVKKGYLVQLSKVQAVHCVIGDTRAVLNTEGMTLERMQENVGKCIADMIDELNKIVVVQGTTINVVAMNAIKERFKQILKYD